MLQLAMLLACAFLFLLVMPKGFSRALPSNTETAVPPKVLHVEGLLHGFLVLRSLEGEVLAEGEITQVAHGDRLKITLVFHFKDTSLDQEDVLFSQHHVFRIFSYHMLVRSYVLNFDVCQALMQGSVLLEYRKKLNPRRKDECCPLSDES